jgi:hypothetical protein
MLGLWDSIAPYFRFRHLASRGTLPRFKDVAFRNVYGELITKIVQHLPARANILKTDLWNEGIEDDRNIATFAHTCTYDSALVCTDVSRYVCESARALRRTEFHIVRATLLASPFRPLFDLIIDASTVDHMPANLREHWISAESSMLRPNGVLLISFDCRLNLFDELYHRFFTRKLYPEWTLVPSEVRSQLVASGLSIVREHAIFVAGLFWGTHRTFHPFSRALRRRIVFDLLRNFELSGRSRWLSFLAPQYVIVARKTGTISSGTVQK